MFKILNEHQLNDVLILNYNTIILQSTGYLRYMQELGIESVLSHLPHIDFLRTVLQCADKCTAKIIDRSITEEFYFEFVKTKFVEVTERSDVSSMIHTINIMKLQPFVNSVHIASPTIFDGGNFFIDIFYPVFDIFNTEEVVKYIKENNINTVWVHDAKMLRDLILREDIDQSKMSYLLSKIGYNYTEQDDAVFLKYPEIMDLRLVKNFTIGIVDLAEPEGSESMPNIF